MNCISCFWFHVEGLFSKICEQEYSEASETVHVLINFALIISAYFSAIQIISQRFCGFVWSTAFYIMETCSTEIQDLTFTSLVVEVSNIGGNLAVH